MNDFNENEINSILPQFIKEALKRKSSRDPSSRFPKKLHMLLSFVTDQPKYENQIGLSWVNDVEFKMNKKTVSNVMGIKLNTINVNLRDLHFEQLQHDKNGWTRWKKNGFSKNSISPDQPAETIQMNSEKNQNIRKNKYPKENNSDRNRLYSSIGKIDSNSKEYFDNSVLQLWSKLFSVPFNATIHTKVFIEATAKEFKQEEQPIENAIEVINAIIAPDDRPLINYSDLYKFLAMFGPAETAMLKIAELLRYSNSSGNWLHFTNDIQMEVHSSFTGSFDPLEPNCLVLRYKTGDVIKVWNQPLILATEKPYIIDENGHEYASWSHYFLSFRNSNDIEMNY